MVNFYDEKYRNKIKKECTDVKNEPLDSFKSAVMRVLGTDYKGTEKWVRNYELAGIIEISKNNGNCWVVNWLK